MKLPMTYHEIVDEIVRFTDLPRDEVEHRVWMQALDPGWNVLQDVARFRVTPHVYDERMEELYRSGCGFILSTLVFWAKQHRSSWPRLALQRIDQYARRTGVSRQAIKILMLGDGTGSDSLFLADNGLQIDYYDIPDSKTYDFALRRFEHYGFLKRGINPVNDRGDCLSRRYDIVLSFEVLEHLPDPVVAINEIGLMLKNNGLALITEDFGNATPDFPTHLKSNVKFFGKTPFLFMSRGMMLTWYNTAPLFKPMEFTRSEVAFGPKDRLRLLSDHSIRSAYLGRHFSALARRIQKLAYI